jgi:xylan 1,4-beta-xylosidase
MTARMKTLLASLLLFAGPASAADAPRAVTITVDAARVAGTLKPVWRFFGADEPNYATMKDGRKLLTSLGQLRADDVYFRAHNLLSSGDGTPSFKWGSTNVYTKAADGTPRYDWTIVDHIIDTYRARGVRPYLQIGFMPEALSSAPAGTAYQHSWRPGFDYRLIATGWTWPPDDYGKWGELVYQWTKHNVERYGSAEVAKWYFEVWNEANLPVYWHGTPQDFYKLHDIAIAAVRRALPTARVGGPDVAGAGGDFMDGFLEHVVSGTNFATGEKGTPTDFLSFHSKGKPSFVDGHVRMGLSTHLTEVDKGFAKVRAQAALADKPVVIGESDPEGCAACPGPQNAYRNGTLYSSYTAASFARIWELAAKRGVNLDGVLSWSFEFEDQPWFAGYRQLATNGVDLPVLNVFRLFAKLGNEQLVARSDAQVPLERVMADGVRGDADVGVLATRTANGDLAVLLWHYHDDDVPGPDAAVRLQVDGARTKPAGTAQVFRIDGTHANSFAAWKSMGAPLSPNETQYRELELASALRAEVLEARLEKRRISLDIVIPRQGVALLLVPGGR